MEKGPLEDDDEEGRFMLDPPEEKLLYHGEETLETPDRNPPPSLHIEELPGVLAALISPGGGGGGWPKGLSMVEE